MGGNPPIGKHYAVSKDLLQWVGFVHTLPQAVSSLKGAKRR